MNVSCQTCRGFSGRSVGFAGICTSTTGAVSSDHAQLRARWRLRTGLGSIQFRSSSLKEIKPFPTSQTLFSGCCLMGGCSSGPELRGRPEGYHCKPPLGAPPLCLVGSQPFPFPAKGIACCLCILAHPSRTHGHVPEPHGAVMDTYSKGGLHDPFLSTATNTAAPQDT